MRHYPYVSKSMDTILHIDTAQVRPDSILQGDSSAIKQTNSQQSLSFDDLAHVVD